MLKYWSNIFGMLGVAIMATAFFRPDWQAGCLTGCAFVLIGALLYRHHLPGQKEGE